MELRQNKKGTEDPSPPPPGPECRRTKPPRRSLMCLLLLTLLPFPRFPLYFLLPNGKVATWPPPQTSADFFFVFFFLVSFLFRFQLAASASIGTPRPSKRQEPSVSWRDPPLLEAQAFRFVPLGQLPFRTLNVTKRRTTTRPPQPASLGEIRPKRRRTGSS